MSGDDSQYSDHDFDEPLDDEDARYEFEHDLRYASKEERIHNGLDVKNGTLEDAARVEFYRPLRGADFDDDALRRLDALVISGFRRRTRRRWYRRATYVGLWGTRLRTRWESQNRHVSPMSPIRP
jgi:hypothetical protein